MDVIRVRQKKTQNPNTRRRLANMRDVLVAVYLDSDGHYHQFEERLYADHRFEVQAALDRYRDSKHKDLSESTQRAFECLELYWGLYQGQRLPSTPLSLREVGEEVGLSTTLVARQVRLALELLIRDLDHDVRRASVMESLPSPSTQPQV